MSENKSLYQVPGQYEDNGLICCQTIYAANLRKIQDDLVLNKDDVLSTSYMKTGSSWVNEILFLIRCDADEERAAGVPRHEKYPFLEYEDSYQMVENMPSPRLLKTHLPARYFTRALTRCDGPKVILCTRNPKDTLVSKYHFHRSNKELGNFTGSWDEFFELYRNDAIVYENMFKFNVGWMTTKYDNLLMVKYEDLHKDTAGQIRRMAAFIGKDFTDEQIQTIIRLSSFGLLGQREKTDTKMAAVIDPSISPFFRKGKVGDWKNYFTAEQSEYVDRQCKDLYEPMGLTFDFE